MSDISNRIKTLRLSAGMNQEEFGQLFGVVKSTVSLYESGKSTPNDEIKRNICEYFGVSMDYLLGLSDEALISGVSTDQERKMLSSFRELNEDNKDIIIGEIKKTLRDQRLEESVAADSQLKTAK